MPMTLHIAADYLAVENIQRGEQGRRAMPLVVVGHGSSAALFQRRPRLGAVERLKNWLFSSTDRTMACAGGST